jgi:hypothetical protein
MVLSPAAQAVLDAMYQVNMDFSGENAQLAAAALHAAADQVAPSRRNYQEASDILATTCLNGMSFVANELRLMADDLESP